MTSPFPYLVLWPVLLLKDHKVAGLLPLGHWLYIVSKRLNLGFSWGRGPPFQSLWFLLELQRDRTTADEYISSSFPLKTEGSLQGKHSMFSTVFVTCFRLHRPRREGRGCKKHDLKSNIQSSVIQEKVCLLFHSQHPLFQTLRDSLFPDVNTGMWAQKVLAKMWRASSRLSANCSEPNELAL